MEGHDGVPGCWVTHAESGFGVAPPRWTLLVPNSIHTSTYSVLSVMVSTVRKSHARIPAAWDRRNSLHVGPRRGAGPSPRRRRSVAMVGGRDPDPQLEQLSPDPHVAPPGILPPQSEDQLPDLGVESGASGRAVRPGPFPSHHLPMPPERGLGPDQEGDPRLLHVSGTNPDGTMSALGDEGGLTMTS
jgi:hypothetical protein